MHLIRSNPTSRAVEPRIADNNHPLGLSPCLLACAQHTSSPSSPPTTTTIIIIIINHHLL
jgi:hypothetical protein